MSEVVSKSYTMSDFSNYHFMEIAGIHVYEQMVIQILYRTLLQEINNNQVHWRTLKTQKKKIIIFCIQNISSLLKQIKTDGNDNLFLPIPNTGDFKDTGFKPATHR